MTANQAEHEFEREDDAYERMAPFYDLVLDGFSADIELYDALARRVEGSVLELGCGTGRMALELARRGRCVTGIDRSQAMLAVARERLTAAGLLGRVDLRREDMRRPTVAGRFGLIVCALDTFLHLQSTADQLDTLRAAHDRLRADGLIAIDLPGPASWGDWETGARPLVLDWTRRLDDRTITRLSSYRSDGATQLRYVTDIFDETFPDGTLRHHVFEYPLRFVFPAEMELLLQRAGLRLHARHGGYQLEPFDAASERMVILASA